MSSEPARTRYRRKAAPDPYAQLWDGASRRRSAHRRSRRHTVRVTIVSVIAVVVAGLLAVPLVQQWAPVGNSATGPVDAAAGGGGVAAKASSDPFDGTPAERYAVGIRGVVLPKPKQVGSWPASDVRTVMTQTRSVLVAARLDPRVVQRGSTAAYLKLLSPATRGMVSASIRRGGPGLGYVTRLAPGFTLDPKAKIRVAGKMTARAGRDGQLVVMADYVWVYPLRGGKPSAAAGPGSTLVVLHTVESYEVYRPEAIAASDRGLRPGGGNSYTFNMDCSLVGKGLLGLPPPDQGGRPSSPDDAAYSPNTNPKSIRSTC
ncbi:MAG TPA: hypothetical protein VGO94_03295 [Mycobacteriales bacterium]|jgi:hypothetical protein|nr:hypothetical protein [Mycobacteriales bacterium]